MNQVQDLSLIIQSRVPLVVIESHEEHRVLDMIRNIGEELKKPMFSWSVTDGMRCHDSSYLMQGPKQESEKPETVLGAIRQARTPAIYVLCDFHPYLENAPHIIRLLKEIAIGHDYLDHTVIFLSTALLLPEDLRPYSARFDIPMPDMEELEKIVREEAEQWSRSHQGVKVVTHKSTLNNLVRCLQGLPYTDAQRLARKAIYDDGAITESDLPDVNKAKFELMGMDGMLNFELETASFGDVGGLKNLKEWLDQRKPAFHGSLKAAGLESPKGIMLLGIQGGGKSLAAKAVAGVWSVPLLRMDFAVLYNKFFGETEKNLRTALKTAELMAPCVLWVDEIEKGVATSDHDSGTSRRILGNLLTWMSERTTRVFIVATANDISQLPPELVRKGRLDEIFFVDLPDETSRADIFRIHLEKRGRFDPDFDLAALARLTRGYSGAEIEQIVVSGLYQAVGQDQELATGHLVEQVKKTHPLSVVMAEHITQLRQWAAGRTVSAN